MAIKDEQILALKAKHEHDKLVFEMKIMELQKKLKAGVICVKEGDTVSFITE